MPDEVAQIRKRRLTVLEQTIDGNSGYSEHSVPTRGGRPTLVFTERFNDSYRRSRLFDNL